MSKRQTKGRGNATAAEKADKYKLYLKSVQEPTHEVSFLGRAFKHCYGRAPKVLREDFCGTYAVCCQWVKSAADRKAIGVDIDPEPLGWGTTHILPKLKPAQQQRVRLIQDDVHRVTGPKADVLAAQNFSFWIFKTRPELLAYFQAAYRNLRRKGVMVLDMVGGSEVLEEDHEDVTAYGKFDYVWNQYRFDPITHDYTCYIHFRFKDGSELHRAFAYHWRLWTIPEVCEVLAEAGFKHSAVYWEDADAKTGEGNGSYRRRKHGRSDPSWIAYIVGAK